SFRLARGKTLGVVGESGSGKTTMGLLLARLHKASGGQVLFDGKDLLALSPRSATRYKPRIQIVFQNPYASLNPRFTVGEILQDEYRMSYVFISHDLAVVKYMADEVMVMKDGEVVEMAGADEIYANPAHPYTKLLLAAMPGRISAA